MRVCVSVMLRRALTLRSSVLGEVPGPGEGTGRSLPLEAGHRTYSEWRAAVDRARQEVHGMGKLAVRTQESPVAARAGAGDVRNLRFHDLQKFGFADGYAVAG